MNVDRNRIRELKRILESNNFYPFLCEFSNNDFNTVIFNLSKLINYVLSADNYSYTTLEELLTMAINYQGEKQYLIYGTNSYLDNTIKFHGLKPDRLANHVNAIMAELEGKVSYLDYGKNLSLPIYGTIDEAIEQAFMEPKMLYQGILRQPSSSPQPITVGETETSYYSSVLERRMNNVPHEYRNTGAIISKKILHEIIGQDVTLYFLPTNKEIGHNYLNRNVSALSLRSIKIPSKYKIISICAANKHLKEGTKLSPLDGSELTPQVKTPNQTYSSLQYDIQEPITIDDSFVYTNSELSGDVMFDIDEIYGRLDAKNNRDGLKNISLSERLKRIHASYDLKVEKRDGKYCITNGRHRILFLKHYYITTKPEAVNERLSSSLKNSVTIMALVNKTIEDPEINKLLVYLEKRFADAVVRLYKVNIKDDNPDLMIIIGDKVYHSSNKYELAELIELLEHDELDNKYFIGNNVEQTTELGNSIVAKVITMLGDQFQDMDFIEFINYIKENEIEINSKLVDKDNLNYRDLYHTYTYFINIGIVRRASHNPEPLASTCERYLQEHESNLRKKGV